MVIVIDTYKICVHVYIYFRYMYMCICMYMCMYIYIYHFKIKLSINDGFYYNLSQIYLEQEKKDAKFVWSSKFLSLAKTQTCTQSHIDKKLKY